MKLKGGQPPAPHSMETGYVEILAMEAVMAAEKRLGFLPRDVSADKCGYDIESRDPAGNSQLRFIEVKGRVRGADSITVTKNEILTALNKPEQFILAIVQVALSAGAQANGGQVVDITYVRKPFGREPDFGVTSVNYRLPELIKKGGPPQ